MVLRQEGGVLASTAFLEGVEALAASGALRSGSLRSLGEDGA